MPCRVSSGSRGGRPLLADRLSRPGAVALGLQQEAPALLGLTRALEGLAQASRLDRFQQVVDRAHVERGYRVLGVRSTEDHDRAIVGQQPQHIQARQPRHLDVQQHDVDAPGAHPLQGLVGVRALAAQAHVGHRLQQAHQPPAGGRLVVHHQHLQRTQVGRVVLAAGLHAGASRTGPLSGRLSSATVRAPTPATVSDASAPWSE